MPARLPTDANVLAYFGFDEANVGDPALDETANARQLMVTGAVSVVPARLGNGRQFDGVVSKAMFMNATDEPSLRQNMALTILVWVTLDSVLQSGSQARTVVCCDADGGVNGRTLYDLYVANDGSISYEHQTDAGDVIRFRTAPGMLRTGRYYSLALLRAINTFTYSDGGLGRVYPALTLLVNNIVTPWAAVTVNGVPVIDLTTVPLPATVDPVTARQTFKVGFSGRRPDAYWNGVIDELSIHNIARPPHPYLDAVYYRVTNAVAFTRLTAQGDIRSVGSVEMGGGSRWWCYERDRSIYVVRENSIGLFSKEIMLATGGASPVDVNQPLSWLMPAGYAKPRLAYDAASDTLLITFVAAGRIYKIVAGGGDAPATLNTPSTASTTTVIKSAENVELFRQNAGAPGDMQARVWYGVVSTVPTPYFFDEPSPGVVSFGIIIPLTTYGVALIRIRGVNETLVEKLRVPYTPPAPPPVDPPPPGGQLPAPPPAPFYFHPIAPSERNVGTKYVVANLDAAGNPTLSRSVLLEDWEGTFGVTDLVHGNVLVYNRAGDAGAALRTKFGENVGESLSVPFTVVTRTPIKLPLADVWNGAIGINADRNPMTVVTRTPIKIPAVDAWAGAVGASPATNLTSTGRKTRGVL